MIYDFAQRLGDARTYVQLDSDGKIREIDQSSADSTDATFKLTTEQIPKGDSSAQAIAAFTPHKDGKFGITIAEYEVRL